MKLKIRKRICWRLLNLALLCALLGAAAGTGTSAAVSAQGLATTGIVETTPLSATVLSDGQFVYGPNVGDFDIQDYFQENAPHLLPYEDDLYERAEYFSINPRVLIALLEIHARLVSVPDPARLENPFELPGMDFTAQVESVSQTMTQAYYLHLYTFTALPPARRDLPPLVTAGGETRVVDPETNAGTYALMAGMANLEDGSRLSLLLDNGQEEGFYQTYRRLFPGDDPLDESNHVFHPGEVGALAAPDNFLQLPYPRGESWKFGGVHDSGGGGGSGTPFNDASSMDFFPGTVSWDGDTSNMWVVASAPGTPTKISACYFRIVHADGWETTYYHLENIQPITGPVKQNDRIAIIANTLAEATCSGGFASGPHVHFSLKRYGALVAINGTPLSGWVVHAGRYNYDTDPAYMWLERGGLKKFPFSDRVLSEMSMPATFADVPTTYWARNEIERLYAVGITGGCGSAPLIYCPEQSVTRAQMALFLERGMNIATYIPPAATGTVFFDVPSSYWSAAWIEKLFADGITGGCGGGNYCPDTAVSRAQMAVFLLRAMHGSGYVPPPAAGAFPDVPTTYWAAPWIEQLYAEGITSGCGGGNYCPDNPVTRAQMAIFLVRTFGLP